MRFPQLVPDWVCTTPITITIEGEGITEDGAPAETISVTGMCNWQDGGKSIFTTEQKIVHVSGTAYFNGDIVPGVSNITGGSGIIFGETREIDQGFKRRNPDGTVNYTEVRFK
jgi:hypothetical protein